MQKTGCLSFVLAILMAFTCLTAVSCGNTAAYSADVPVLELCATVDALLPNPEDFAVMTDDYMSVMMEIDPTAFEDYAVKLRASGANIDEYGIFKVADGTGTADALAVVNAYLANRVAAWMPEYMPEEFPKMEAASVKVFGQYVVYAVLGEDVKTDVFAAIEDKLLEK